MARNSRYGLVALVTGALALLLGAQAQESGVPRGSVTLAKGAPRPRGRNYYVSPTGSASGDGSIGKPWDLQTALSQPSTVQPGDKIWLRGGTYTGVFNSYLNGDAANPIVVQQYPGERATIDGGNSRGVTILTVAGSHTWFWGFEVTSSYGLRTSNQTGPAPSDVLYGAAIDIDQSNDHPGLRFINLVLHDTRAGFGWWKQAVDSEIYGSLIYYNGWSAPDGVHGHGIYAQNQIGTKRAVDNIVFYQFSHGFHAYGSTKAYLDNFYLEGNTIFMNGEIGADGERNILIGGDGIAHNPQLVSNYLYYGPTGPGSAFKLGYGAPCSNPIVTGNYCANGTQFYCGSMTISGNTFYGGVSFSKNQFAANTFLTSRPTGTQVFVRPNLYEAGRANITVYNWNDLDTVNVGLGSIMTVGDSYEVRNAQNFFGPPVLTGTYDGRPLAIRTSGLVNAQPIGYSAAIPEVTDLKVFVLLRTNSVRRPLLAPTQPARRLQQPARP
jgi:hypothetical protein